MKELNGRPREGELEKINAFARSELKEEDVYVFSVVLCDNEIDRDNEKFSDAALEKLAKMFIGVTGITDHDPKSRNQTARIFDCRTEKQENRLNSCGETYRCVKARAYIPRSEKSEEFIRALDSGIIKEVSVGCAVKKKTCSVCGRDISLCEHVKGRSYGGRKCYAILDEPEDAYEWSFVAVPAQREAGVTKSYSLRENRKSDKGGEGLDILKKLYSGGEMSLSEEETRELAERFSELEKKASDGEYYREGLIREIRSLSSLVLPELGEGTLQGITKGLSVKQLDELKKAFEKKAQDVLPVKPQLCRSEARTSGNTIYQNI